MKPARLFLGLLTLSFFASARAQDSVALPKVSVAANVPLIKVAEHRMLEKRFAPAAVTDGRYLYFIGGQDASGALLNSIERFDPETGKSEPFARLQTARLWHRAVVHQGKIFVLGGATPAFRKGSLRSLQPAGRPLSPLVLCDKVETVELATGHVGSMPPMPTPRKEFGCVVIGGKIHVLGGQHLYKERSSCTSSVDVLDLASGGWAPGVPMLKPVASEAVLVDGPFIIVPGGYDGSAASDEVQIYNPAKGNWSFLPSLCKESSAHSVVSFRNHLLLFGNYSHPGELIAYDLATKTSETFTLQYTPSRHAAAVALAGRIYVAGGKRQIDGIPLDSIQVFASPPRRAAP
jgi:hypothetical protein